MRLAVVMLFAAAGPVVAQAVPGAPAVSTGYPTFGGNFPYAAVQPPGGFLPNIYSQQTQPLSPYLNFLRGGNPAANYFFGVRPGVAARGPAPAFAGPPVAVGSQLRTGFLPAAAAPSDQPTPLPEAGVKIPNLPPSGHPVTYGGGSGRYLPGTGTAAAPRPGVTGNAAPPPYRR